MSLSSMLTDIMFTIRGQTNIRLFLECCCCCLLLEYIFPELMLSICCLSVLLLLLFASLLLWESCPACSADITAIELHSCLLLLLAVLNPDDHFDNAVQSILTNYAVACFPCCCCLAVATMQQFRKEYKTNYT